MFTGFLYDFHAYNLKNQKKNIESPKVMVRGFVQHDVPDALKKCGLDRYFFVRIGNITLCYEK